MIGRARVAMPPTPPNAQWPAKTPGEQSGKQKEQQGDATPCPAETWQPRVSRSTGREYYHNPTTGESTYDKPAELLSTVMEVDERTNEDHRQGSDVSPPILIHLPPKSIHMLHLTSKEIDKGVLLCSGQKTRHIVIDLSYWGFVVETPFRSNRSNELTRTLNRYKNVGPNLKITFRSLF